MSVGIPIGIGGPLTSAPTSIGSVANSSVADNASSSFGDVFKNALNQVSSLEGNAQQQVATLLQGGNADMSKVMISVEKADVAFQLMMQMRNKIVSAYQDIEKMQF